MGRSASERRRDGAIVGVVTLASFIISLFALVVAVVAALYARQQAVETRRQRQIEEDRRRQELAAETRLVLEPVNGGSWHRLVLDNTTDRDVVGAVVDIVDGPGCWFTPGTNGVEARYGQLPQRAQLDDVDRLEPGRRHMWRIEFDEQRTTGTLRVHAALTSAVDTSAPRTWTKVVDLKAPVDLSRTVA